MNVKYDLMAVENLKLQLNVIDHKYENIPLLYCDWSFWSKIY